MSRVRGHVLSQVEFPCGRLVQMPVHYDAQEQIMEFTVPSLSREDRVYGLELDMVTGEVACGCEAGDDFRNARRMPYRLDEAGTPAELLAKEKGRFLLPLVTRRPMGLCAHARRVRAYIVRHGWLPYFQGRESQLIERLKGVARCASA